MTNLFSVYHLEPAVHYSLAVTALLLKIIPHKTIELNFIYLTIGLIIAYYLKQNALQTSFRSSPQDVKLKNSISFFSVYCSITHKQQHMTVI